MKRMMKISRLLSAAVLLLAACSGDGTGPRIPASMQIVSGDLQVAPVGTELPDPLVVRVLDDRGRPVRGQIINFRVVSGGGSVFAGSAETNGDGEARERWTLGPTPRDTQRVEARAVDPATGQALTFAVFRAVGTAGSASSVAVVHAPTRLPVGGSDSVVVRVLDALGNPVPDVPVTWTVTEGGGTVQAAESRTGADGLARTTWTMGSARLQQGLRVSTPGAPPQTVAAEAGDYVLQRAGSGQIVPPGGTLADSLRLIVTWQGQPAAGVPVQWSTTFPGTLVGEPVTDAQGVARASWTLGTATSTQYVAVARVPRLGGDVQEMSFSAWTTGGTPARLEANRFLGGSCPIAWYGQVSDVPAGEIRQQPPIIYVYDAANRPLVGIPVQWSASGDGAALPATTTTDVNGRATTAWRLSTRVGTDTMTATVAGAGSVTLFSAVCYGAPAVTVASVEQVTLAPGDSVWVNAGWRDRFGNGVPYPAGSVTGGTGGTLDSSVAVARGPVFGEQRAGILVRGVAPGTTKAWVRYGGAGVTADTVVVVVTGGAPSRAGAPAASRSRPAAGRAAPAPVRTPPAQTRRRPGAR
jgi:hypothetical protein